jgi:hypothetical protein
VRDILVLFIHVVVTLVRLSTPGGLRSVVAESVLVRHQLLILNRGRQRSPNLRLYDRVIAGLCTILMRPARVLKSAMGPAQELIDAVVEMKRRNPAWGCRRIAQQVSPAFGVDIDRDVVRRILATHFRPESGNSGPSWLTFLGHAKDSLWSVDLFRLESLTLQTHWVLVVMDQFTRRIIGFGIHRGIVDGVGLCRMFRQAISGNRCPNISVPTTTRYIDSISGGRTFACWK